MRSDCLEKGKGGKLRGVTGERGGEDGPMGDEISIIFLKSNNGFG